MTDRPSAAPEDLRTVVVAPDEPVTAALLDAYFRERERGFAQEGGYRVVHPDPAAFVPPAGVFLRLDADRAGSVGCGGARRIADGPLGTRFEVKHLFVRGAARGWGGGRMLLGALVAWARAAGGAELVLDTNRSLTAAARLYRTTGFAPIPAYNDNPNATDWFGLPLAPTAG